MYRNTIPSARTCRCRNAPWQAFLRGLAQVHSLESAGLPPVNAPTRSLPLRPNRALVQPYKRSLHSSTALARDRQVDESADDAPPASKPKKKRWREMSVDELTEWHSALRWKKKAMAHGRIQEERKEAEFMDQFEEARVDQRQGGNVRKTRQRDKPNFVEKQQMDLEQVKLERKIARAEIRRASKPKKEDLREETGEHKAKERRASRKSAPKLRPRPVTKGNSPGSKYRATKPKSTLPEKPVAARHVPSPRPLTEQDSHTAPKLTKNARKKLARKLESLNAMNICVLPRLADRAGSGTSWLPIMTLQILEPREADPETTDKLNPAEARYAHDAKAIDQAAAFSFVLPRLHGRAAQSELPALSLRILEANKPGPPTSKTTKQTGGRKVNTARTRGSAAVTARNLSAADNVDVETPPSADKRPGRKSRKEMADLARRAQAAKPLPGVRDYLQRQENRKLRKEQELKDKAEDPEAFARKQEAKKAQREKPQWAVQKEALKKKFPEGWNPRKKLSPDALTGIRALNAQFPDVYTTQALSDKFQMDPEAIRRILKSKWEPSPEQEERRQKAWHERGLAIWERKAALGIKPPRKWRREGVAREPGWKEYRQKVARRESAWEREETERYQQQRASLSSRLAGKVL